eukprot:426883-Prymnesium_polylepis.1
MTGATIVMNSGLPKGIGTLCGSILLTWPHPGKIVRFHIHTARTRGPKPPRSCSAELSWPGCGKLYQVLIVWGGEV